MSGLESHKGHNYQTKCTLYAFLKLWSINSEFTLVGEPPSSDEDGSIVDINIILLSSKKKIQVKRTTDGTTVKKVLKEFIADYLLNEDIYCELWFSDCYAEGTPLIIKNIEKAKDKTVHKMREGGIKGKLGGINIKIHLDETIADFRIDGENIMIHDFEYLDSPSKSVQLEQQIASTYGIQQHNILATLKKVLDDTAEYRKYKLIQSLGEAMHTGSRLLEPDNNFFDRVKLTKIHRNNILNEIDRMLPQEELSPNGRQILAGYLCSYFSDNVGEEITPVKIEKIITTFVNEFSKGTKNYCETHWECRMTCEDDMYLTLLEPSVMYTFAEEVPRG